MIEINLGVDIRAKFMVNIENHYSISCLFPIVDSLELHWNVACAIIIVSQILYYLIKHR